MTDLSFSTNEERGVSKSCLNKKFPSVSRGAKAFSLPSTILSVGELSHTIKNRLVISLCIFCVGKYR
ncbi:Uncharacterised protein [Chlamydia trachomatis]|nr:Uncharacterised protein [Chlamydia trachomatis]